MRVVIAPQAFKGSVRASVAAAALARGWHRVFPHDECILVPVADGGDGTLEALVSATGGRYEQTEVTGPLGQKVVAQWGVLGDGQTAVLETAQACGLVLVPPERRDPRITTTYGVGELFRAALDKGFRRFLVGLGGSATNDGGAGMAQALGIRLLDGEGRDLPWGGEALLHLARLDPSRRDPRIAQSQITVAVDVTNPLCGPQGASAVYGPQKGATPEMVALLDTALERLAQVVRRDLGKEVAHLPGAGAAGGMGAGLVAFLDAHLAWGADIILEAVRLQERLEGAHLVLVGEGQMDFQTAFNKAPAAVAKRAKARGIPVIALVGGLGKGYQDAYRMGIDAVVPIAPGPLALEEAMRRAEDLLADAAERTARLLAVGRRLPF
ncbi:MAG: glycerate kinase [Dehalococcoidia bacterium]|nr:glycerate kinase [Dehalococcoidia bacterium]MDW8120224.1 glycerate kinase [Chloroflexota bacterium]